VAAARHKNYAPGTNHQAAQVPACFYVYPKEGVSMGMWIFIFGLAALFVFLAEQMDKNNRKRKGLPKRRYVEPDDDDEMDMMLAMGILEDLDRRHDQK
jgi:hypothetical protein